MVFQHILWMYVCLRLLGSEPAFPLPGVTLFEYAATLEIQYCELRISAGAAARREARELTHNLIHVLGLPQAAEPLPPSLLPVLLRYPTGFPTS
jgi:hypothetical protein